MQPAPSTTTVLSPSRERALLWLLALTQFTIIMDFMMMMPLAPLVMSAFDIGPAAFAAAVSAYAWCAGLSGVFAATYVDRFDRRRLMLTVYALFALSNLACALAPSFAVLLAARAFAGLTGGIMGSIIMSVLGDVIPANRRGAATGIVMTAISMAAAVGVPAGIVLGAQFGWASPFYLLVVFTVLIWMSASRIVPSLRSHLAATPTPLSRVFPQLLELISNPAHLRAFLATALVMSSSMLVIPFIAPVLVANYGIAPRDISWIYLAGGLTTLFTARAVGRMADRYGKHLVFRCVAGFSMLPLLFMTHLPEGIPLWGLIAFFPFFMASMSGRHIPLQALMTTVPDPARRGAFLSVNSAVQYLGTGVGAWAGGMLLSTGPDGQIVGYEINGWLAAGLTLFNLLWIAMVRSRPVHSTNNATAA
jgi:predicted MFS family arabinose efflux permease